MILGILGARIAKTPRIKHGNTKIQHNGYFIWLFYTRGEFIEGVVVTIPLPLFSTHRDTGLDHKMNSTSMDYTRAKASIAYSHHGHASFKPINQASVEGGA